MIGIIIPEIDLLVRKIIIVEMNLVEEINHMIAIILKVIDLDRGIETIIRIGILIQGITEIIEINQGITEIIEINRGTGHIINMIVMQMEEINHQRPATVEILMPILLFVM
jgi:hypothetical protein